MFSKFRSNDSVHTTSKYNLSISLKKRDKRNRCYGSRLIESSSTSSSSKSKRVRKRLKQMFCSGGSQSDKEDDPDDSPVSTNAENSKLEEDGRVSQYAGLQYVPTYLIAIINCSVRVLLFPLADVKFILSMCNKFCFLLHTYRVVKANRSIAWKYFDIINAKRRQCKLCGKMLQYCGSSTSFM